MFIKKKNLHSPYAQSGLERPVFRPTSPGWKGASQDHGKSFNHFADSCWTQVFSSQWKQVRSRLGQ